MEEKKIAIIVSPNWRDYGRKYLGDCLSSIRRQDYLGETKIFLIDNETTEESYHFLQETAAAEYGIPGDSLSKDGSPIKIVREEKNEGFCKSNNDAMRLALAQGYDHLLLFNIDTVLEAGAVSEMVKLAETDALIGAVQARLMLHPETDKVNSLGNATHFLGFGYTLGYKHRLPAGLAVADIFYPSGAAVLFKAAALKHVGLYDEEYWMYNEDQEHGWRLRLAGYRSVLAPAAVVYHKFEFSRSAKKFYWMDRNRIISMLKCYALPTLVLVLPAFLIMEVGLLAFSLLSGWFADKLRVYGYFLRAGNWRKILQGRREAQKIRKVRDRQLAKLITGRILFQEFDGLALRLANIFLGAYWSVIRMIIFW